MYLSNFHSYPPLPSVPPPSLPPSFSLVILIFMSEQNIYQVKTNETTKQALFRGVTGFQPASTLSELLKPIPIASSQALLNMQNIVV